MAGVLDASAVRRSSTNVEGVILALKDDATVEGYDATWYDVAIAGFNFVDRQCVDYFNDLFFLERQRNALRSGFGAFAQTTDAILIATGATSLTLSVVAQAFGLAQKVTEIVADSFLYKLPPATTMGFVREMQSAYRIGVAQQPARINSPVQAYHEIQRYLELCLPPTIEARLVDHISGAKAIAVASPGDTQVVVGSEVSPSGKVDIARLGENVVSSEDRPLRDGGSGQGQGRNPTQDVHPAVLAMYGPNSKQNIDAFLQDQKRLCIATPANNYGRATKTAVAIHRRTLSDEPDPSLGGDGPLFALEKPEEQARYATFKANPDTGAGCDTTQFVNVWEASRLKSPEAVDDFVSSVNDLKLDGVSVTAPEKDGNKVLTSESSSTFRQSIGALRDRLKNCGLVEEIYDNQNHITRNLMTSIMKARNDIDCTK